MLRGCGHLSERNQNLRLDHDLERLLHKIFDLVNGFVGTRSEVDRDANGKQEKLFGVYCEQSPEMIHNKQNNSQIHGRLALKIEMKMSET